MAVYKRFTREKSKEPKKLLKQTELQARWEQRVSEGEAVKEKWKKEYQSDLLETVYYGHQKPSNWSDKDWFTLNLLFSSVKILKRNVCPRDLRVRMKLTRSLLTDSEMIIGLERLTKLRAAVLQYFVDRLKLWKEGRLAYMNSLWQFGCLKIGYSAEMEDNPNAGGVTHDRSGAIIYDEDNLPVLEEKQRVKTEEFFIDQVDPDCLLVDRYCENDPDKSGHWIAHKIFTSVQKLQDDSYYPKEKTKDLGPSSLEDAERLKLRDDQSMRTLWSQTGGTLPENEIIVLYEIYDLERKQVLTLARGAQDILRVPEPLPPGVDLHPFVFLKLNERRASFYPVPTLFNWWGPQHEYNLTRNQMALHRKRFNRRYLYDENKIDPEAIEELMIGEDGTFAKARGSGAVEPVVDAPLDSAVYFETSKLKEEFMEISGVGELQRNMVGAESATEAEIVERRSRESEIDEHEEMMNFLSEACKKLHTCMEANLTEEGAVEYIGPAGAEWVSFGPEHFDKIAGEVLFTVEAEEATRVTLQVERAQLLQLIEILGRNPVMALDDVILRALVNKFPALANNELLIERLQQLAMFAIQLQISQQQTKQTGGTKKVQSTSTGKEAGKARKVTTGG